MNYSPGYVFVCVVRFACSKCVPTYSTLFVDSLGVV